MWLEPQSESVWGLGHTVGTLPPQCIPTQGVHAVPLTLGLPSSPLLSGCVKLFASVSPDQQLLSIVTLLPLESRTILRLTWVTRWTAESHSGAQLQPAILSVSDAGGLPSAHG